VAITNENPGWPEADKQQAEDAWQALLTALDEAGYSFRGFKFFDDLSFLDEFDPHGWLVWNWGEELAGRPWSDAAVVEEIEKRGLAYTGGSPALIRLAQDRMGVKRQLQSAGLPTLPAVVLHDPGQAAQWTTFPAIVKGANQHASVGIDGNSIVLTNEELARRVAHMRETYGDDALVEPFVDTREFQVPVWGNEPPEALPPAELVYSTFTEMRDRLYTEAWKSDPTSIGYQRIEVSCPAPLDRPDWRARLESVAVSAYRALGLRDYARFDMRMLGDEPQILDVNVNPELMSDGRSVFVVAARARGIDYARMVATIIELASARMPLS
jgi:D-alanine-D-alanine ligase